MIWEMKLHFKNSAEEKKWSEAALQRCSYEKVFWKHAENLQENTLAEVWFQ